MLLKQVIVENYRGIENVTVDLDRVTVLIGENNTGKTSFLHAIVNCLDRVKSRRGGAFEGYDFHLPDRGAEPSTAEPISITLVFRESQPDEWDNEIVQALNEAVAYQDDVREISLRVGGKYEAATGDFVHEWAFLDAAGNPKPGRAASPQLLSSLQHLRPIFYLSALRDAAREFSSRSQLWGAFLRDINVSPELKQEIEEALGEVNSKVIGAHSSLEEVRTQLSRVQQMVAVGAADAVSIDPLPARIFDLLSRTQISVTSHTGAPIPLTRHGEGTQSLSVLLLFDAFLRAKLKTSYDRASEPIIALEEPEAHLHPSAIRALWKTIDGLTGQVVVATHSGDLLSEAPLTSIRRFWRTPQGITVSSVTPGTLTPEEERKLNYNVRLSRGELFFARCWLLGEGETEVTVLMEVAKYLAETNSDYDLERYGIRVAAYRSCDIEVFLKVANALGIEWHCLMDNDQQGAPDRQKANNHLQGRAAPDHISMLPVGNIEVLLCQSGFGQIYESYLTPQSRAHVTVGQNDPAYWPQVVRALKSSISKPRVALEVVEEIRRRGQTSVPPIIRDALDKAMTLARRCEQCLASTP